MVYLKYKNQCKLAKKNEPCKLPFLMPKNYLNFLKVVPDKKKNNFATQYWKIIIN